MKDETRIDYRERIKRVTCYIDDHIYEPLRLKELSKIACLSEYHFHRVFVACLGMTIQEYINLFRLTRGATLLLNSSLRITDIALESGYETLSSFTQTFRKYFNMTPSQFRTLKGKDLNLHLPGVHSPIEYLEHQQVMRKLRSEKIPYEIREVPELTVMAITKTGLHDGAFLEAGSQAFTQLYEFIEQHMLHEIIGYRLSIVPYIPYEMNDPDAFIQCGFSINRMIQPHGDVEIQTISGGKYAVFSYHGPYDFIYQTWNSAYFTCVLANNEQVRNVPPFEIYFNSPRDTAPEDLKVEIHIPIR
ncbi:MAG TPA: AraC family transcriptional regulator [Deltaproteobacteria bacterium]|nr:AraC family transcriptional regulator [Deltaproteobacteria bacterium]HPJ94833.1 AraC family transcriptional regulator [Deltaproteobacteria bacterium]